MRQIGKLGLYLTLLMFPYETDMTKAAVGTTQRLVIPARQTTIAPQTICAYQMPACVKDGTCYGHVFSRFVPTRKSRLFAEVRMGHRRTTPMDSALQVWVVTKGVSGRATAHDLAILAPNAPGVVDGCITVTFIPDPLTQFISIEIRDSDTEINPDYTPILLYENTYVVDGMTSVFRPVVKNGVILEHPPIDDLIVQTFHHYPRAVWRGESENGLSSCIPFVEGDPRTQILTVKPLGLCTHDQEPLPVQ